MRHVEAARDLHQRLERHSNWLVLPIWGLFVIKVALVIGAYILILLFLIRKLGLVH